MELLFLKRTISMLSETEENIACWSVDGLSFFILNQTVFKSYILERFYKHRDFSSFLRQLDNYGFHRVQSHQSTINFGMKYHGSTPTYQFQHPLLRQHISPDDLLKKRLFQFHKQEESATTFCLLDDLGDVTGESSGSDDDSSVENSFRNNLNLQGRALQFEQEASYLYADHL